MDDLRLVQLAFRLAVKRSDDKEKPVGCFVILEGHKNSYFGTNKLKEGETELWKSKLNIEHAECNALRQTMSINGVQNYKVVTTKFPCSGCANAVVLSGAKELVTPKPNEKSSWYEEQKKGYSILLKWGVKITFVDFDEYEEITKLKGV